MAEFNIEQFKELMQDSDNVNVDSMAQCTARFGGERDTMAVEEFIAAITTFKLTRHISDEQLVAGLPMLLWGEAAEWWPGVKDKVMHLESFVQKFREEYSPRKPAWRIYAEIFENRQQKSEPTESFLRKKRALFAKLSKPPAECDQIDLLFGCLHSQIRERVFRHRVVNFEELLKYAREAEETLKELAAAKADAAAASGIIRCGHCRKKGHTADKCLKKVQLEAQAKQAALATICRTFTKPVLSCYGCNASGFMRFNCPTCSSGSLNPLGGDVPVVNIKIFGVRSQAYMDSGARTSVVSTNLKKILEFHDCPFTALQAEIAATNGEGGVQQFLSTECNIEVGGKHFDVKFVLLPNAAQSRILLGTDFLQQAGIVLNMGQRYWFFEAHPGVNFEFESLWPTETNLLETLNVVDESVTAESAKRKATTELSNCSSKQRAVGSSTGSRFE